MAGGVTQPPFYIDVKACLDNVEFLLSNAPAAQVQPSPHRRWSITHGSGFGLEESDSILMEHNKSAAQTRSVRRALSAQWGCEADDNKGAVVPAKSAARENPSTHGENDIDPNDLSLILPDEILLKIFRHLDGRSLARASCVNKRWFYFVRAYEQHLFRPLCKASDWLDVVASPRHRGLAEHFTVHSPTRVVHNSSHYEAANKENIIVTPPRHSDTSKEPNWRLVFAKNTLLRNVWTNADQAELERRRTAQRSLIVPMDTEAWGASLDAFDGHSSRAS